MKTRTYFIVMIYLFVASFVFAEEVRVFSNEEITGTWINPEYTGFSGNLQKYIISYWGYYEAYIKVDSTAYGYRGTFYIIDKWTDSEGNTLYKSILRYEGGTNYWYEIGKISNDKTRWEYTFSYINLPTESDLKPDSANYRVYYRK